MDVCGFHFQGGYLNCRTLIPCHVWYTRVMRKLILFCSIFYGLFVLALGVEAKVFLPNASGTYSQWFVTGSTCTTGASAGVFGEVDEYSVHNSDTDYNCVNVANQSQSYNLEDSNDSGTITNVRVIAVAKGVTTPEAVQLFVRIGTTDYVATAQNLTTSYATYTNDWANNPATSAAWTTSDISSLQAGFKGVANDTWDSDIQRVSQLYIDVTFKTETNRIKQHILQETSPGLASGGQINQSFTVTISDPLDDIKNAFIEIKGVVEANSTNTNIRVSIDDSALTSGRVKTYTVNSTGRAMPIRILYDVTDYFKEKIRTSGGFTFTLNLKNDGPATVNISSGKLILTYTWIIPPPAGGGQAVSGTLTSTVFETTSSADGPAYNSITWKGTLGGGGQDEGKVRFQLSTSDSSTGPWTFIGGSTCGSGDWYDATNTDKTVETTCSDHNNKRYYRYKIQICSIDCSTAGSNSPTVNDVNVSWSP